MSTRKKKIILLLMVLLLLLVIIVSISSNGEKNITNNNEEENNVPIADIDKNYQYDFNETLDLEANEGSEEIASNGTDYPNFGILGEYYEGAEIRYEEDKMYIQSYDGYDVVSVSWLDESYAQHVNEPSFGVLQRCVLTRTQFSALYIEVTMKDVENYIKELEELGFTEVIMDKKDKKQGYYVYSAKKGDITATVNYTDNNDFSISVF